MIRHILITILSVGFSFAQPELRFQTFDWVQYRYTGKVNSITFSDRFAYMGTQSGGVVRFNLFSDRFEEPITRAQGLHSNTITAIHRSSNSMLWVATPMGIESSLDEKGDWHFIDRDMLGLPSGAYIERIGESEHYIWLDTPGLVYRLDPLTGIMIGIMASPDEPVAWSSGLLRFQPDISEFLIEYSFLDGWMTDLQNLVHPNGQYIDITTIAKNSFNEVWIGTEDGTFFRSDPTMKTMSPFRFSLASNDIQTISGGDSFWLGGRLATHESGLTYFDADREIADNYIFSRTINLDQTSISSILELKKEIWFGGENALLVYDKKKDFWRTYKLRLGGGKSWTTSMIDVGEHVWVGSSQGVTILKKIDKKPIVSKVEKYFNNIYIYDLAVGKNKIWIGTETGLFLYDLEKQIIQEYTTYGYKAKDVTFPLKYYDYTAFTQDSQHILTSNRSGVLKFNFKDRRWSNAVDPSIFGGLEIKTMALHKNIVFIATENGIVQYDMKKNLMDVFNYSFIGQVNDMYIKGRKIWLGTTEGLISYRYR
ncbi:MAG: hypothetical protein ISR82_02435 [Candidatus Marinimicrobia bacterium]|nr:hypothetical protein [Candidatus Neomarinimicrobiota bacterium]MBL7010065.1 hypothetical protein [Candidatus Neomarinimicrobiota bacterium]MBL7030334.1 hypothetical protein [Candidatus Neomarinimicrobiota bacterium]